MEKIRLRVNEAIAYAQKTKPIRKKDLAKMIWKDSTEHCAANNLTNLSSGRSKSVSIDAIRVICRECGVTAGFLLGMEDEPTRFDEVRGKKQELKEYTDLMLDTVSDMKESIDKL